MTMYHTDFFAWANEQANYLKSGNLASLDISNLIEEIESMGRSELAVLKSRLEILTMHLLKYQYQPEKRSKSWQDTIEEQRSRVQDLFEDNPSFKYKSVQVGFLDKIWKYAVLGATKETGMSKDSFPSEPIWTLQQILDNNFYPTDENEIVKH